MSSDHIPERSYAEMLAALRNKMFTGRSAELRLLRELLLGERQGCSVVWLHGMGGVGKTALLRRFADEAQTHGRVARTVDMRHVKAEPEAFEAALAAQGPTEDAHVLVVDSGELLGPVEGWLRDVFLPRMPSHLLVVVAGRKPPSVEWRTDAQWWHVLRSVRLGGMNDAEAAQLLRNRGVSEHATAALVRAAHGLPLALVLLADPGDQGMYPADPRDDGASGAGPRHATGLHGSPELVGELLRLLLRESPTLPQTDALHVLSLARVTSEELVRYALDVPAAEGRELCDWLRGLSFVQNTAEGLVPHPLARDALLTDLRWRGPEKYERLFRRLYGYQIERVRQRTGSRWVFGAGLAHLGRTHRIAWDAVDWRDSDRQRLRPAGPDDLEEVLASVEKEHGVAAGRLALRWWQHQPTAFTVAEDGLGRIVGAVVAPCLEAGSTRIPDDPVAHAALAHTADRSPLRRAERLLLARWITGSTAAACSALTTLWATTPGLAMSWTCAREAPRGLASMLTLYGHRRAGTVHGPEGERVLPFVQDWRGTPFDRWAATLLTRLLADEPAVARAPEAGAEPVMPWPEFADAVKHAYRSALDPRQLAESPLLATRLVSLGGDASELREALVETVAQLRSHPGRRQLGDVLEVTYLSGPRSQQAAASRAGLSFGTYRRRLSSALTRAAELLREREFYGPMPR
ncbi:hypothetical protein MTQ01_13740 [Streptomyces sp. XM4193]|uniref:AAA family ATPase n=1 Tax=Streptomyces sp. XM4193 TaxID=2929782 RepID=UPI001FF894AD|nr:AAA family ATPase [Streptomyces sp. XM4193]MCK1797060.1 hypothetical protein [Streptomyces sp. XM4193]